MNGGNRFQPNASGAFPAKIVGKERGWLLKLRPISAEEEATKKRLMETMKKTRLEATGDENAAIIKKSASVRQELAALIVKGRCSKTDEIVKLISTNKETLVAAMALSADKNTEINEPIGKGKSTLLHSAVWFKDQPVVEALLSIKANPNAQNVKLNTPLHLACEKLPDSKAIVAALINKQGNRFQISSDGSTAVSKAGKLSKWLLNLTKLSPEEEEAKTEADKQSAQSLASGRLDSDKVELAKKVFGELSSLIVAKRCKDEDQIVKMLEKNKSLFVGVPKYFDIDDVGGSANNSTLLHSAVWFNKVEIVQKLLDCLASPNAKNVKENSPLLLGCEKLPESKEVVELLVKTNGNRYLRNTAGDTPLKKTPPAHRDWLLGMRPISDDETRERKAYIEAKRPESASRSNLLDGKKKALAGEVFEELVKDIVKFRCKDTGKIVKTLKKHQELFCGSIKYKNIDSPTDNRNSTLLHSAVWYLKVDIVRALVSTASSPNSKNLKGNTAMHLACEKLPESKEIVEMLVAANGNRYQLNFENATPMSKTPSKIQEWLKNLKKESDDEQRSIRRLERHEKEHSQDKAANIDQARADKIVGILTDLEQLIIKKRCREEQKIVDILESNKNFLTGPKKLCSIDSTSSVFVMQSASGGSTLLHSAVWYKSLPICKALCAVGACPNCGNVKKNSPLHLACEQLPDTKDIVEYFVNECGGNRCISNVAGKSPLDNVPTSELRTWLIGIKPYDDDEVAAERERRAIEKKNKDLQRSLGGGISTGTMKVELRKRDLVDEVVKRYCKDSDKISDLLKMKWPENSLDDPVNSSKQTLLHIAAKLSSSAVVRALLEAKANPSPLDATNSNPLHLATARLPKGKVGVECLVLAGCDRYAANSRQSCPSTAVPSKLRSWYQNIAPMSSQEKKSIGARQRKFKGLDVAMLRVKCAGADPTHSGTLTSGRMEQILVGEGLDSKIAAMHVEHWTTQNPEQKDDVMWKDFVAEFLRMKLFHCLVELGNRQNFDKVDKNHTHSLTKEDFRSYLINSIGREEGKRQCTKLFKKVDANNDGRITIVEVRMWYKKELKLIKKQKADAAAKVGQNF